MFTSREKLNSYATLMKVHVFRGSVLDTLTHVGPDVLYGYGALKMLHLYQ